MKKPSPNTNVINPFLTTGMLTFALWEKSKIPKCYLPWSGLHPSASAVTSFIDLLNSAAAILGVFPFPEFVASFSFFWIQGLTFCFDFLALKFFFYTTHLTDNCFILAS